MKDDISISILDAKDKVTFLNSLVKAKENIQSLDVKTNIYKLNIHFDVMDLKFVPNVGVDLKYVEIAKKMGFFADVHLMVQKPVEDKFIDKAIEYGADNITIHYEIENFEESLKYLLKMKKKIYDKENKNFTIGVSLKPNTKIDVLKKYISKIDRILLMSVEPGKGGQKFIDKINDKIIFAKEKYKNTIIQIDGGINEKTICKPIREGIDSIVIGSYLSKSLNFTELYNKILILNCIHTIEKTPRRANMKLDTTTLQVVDGGYGENDILLGINVPDIRKCANVWYKYIGIECIRYFFSSPFHDYRRFAIFCIINNINILYKKVLKDNKDKNSLKQIKDYFKLFEDNIMYVNNWDLTDVAGPNIFAYILYMSNEKQKKKKLYKYLNSNNFWTKRIAIVSMLNFVKNDYLELPLEVCDYVLYDNFHLFQKATGWVLRELYKKEPKVIVEYLHDKNKIKKLPSILLSYACEKMTIMEKEKIRNDIDEV